MFEASLIESAKHKGGKSWYTCRSRSSSTSSWSAPRSALMWYIVGHSEPRPVQFYSMALPRLRRLRRLPSRGSETHTEGRAVKPSQVTSPMVVPDTLPPPTSARNR